MDKLGNVNPLENRIDLAQIRLELIDYTGVHCLPQGYHLRMHMPDDVHTIAENTEEISERDELKIRGNQRSCRMRENEAKRG